MFVRAPLVDGKLYGVPGGGKTTTILQRVRHLVCRGDLPEAGGGFVVVTFSRAAREDFLLRAARMGTPPCFDSRNVCTIHCLSGRILCALGESAPSVTTVVYRAWRRLAADDGGRCREQVCARMPELRGLRTIIVDEAQDISRVQYEFVRCLKDTFRAASLVLVGDPNQNIYQFQGGSDQHLLSHPGFCVELKKNYRSTGKLVRVIQSARPVETNTPITSESGEDGVDPVLLCASIDSIRRDLVCSVKEHLRSGMSVAVIGPYKRSRVGGASVSGIGLSRVANWLCDEGVPHRLCYSEDSDASAAGAAEPDAPSPSLEPAVQLYTVHGSKGLEFDSVALIDFHHDSGYDTKRYIWFVGLSRSRRLMRVYCVSGRRIWQDFDKYRQFFEVGEGGDQVARVDADPSTSGCGVQAFLFDWDRLLRDHTRVPESVFAWLEDRWVHAPRGGVSARGGDAPPLPEERALTSVYVDWARNAMAYCCLPDDDEPPLVQHVRRMVTHFFVVPRTMARATRHLLDALQMDNSSIISWDKLEELRRQTSDVALDEDLRELISTLFRGRSLHPDGALVHVSDECRWFEPSALKWYLDTWRSDPCKFLFLLSLFRWQYDKEARYRWVVYNRSYDPHVAALRPLWEDIAGFCARLDTAGSETLEFGTKLEKRFASKMVWCTADVATKDWVGVVRFSASGTTTRDMLYAAGCAHIGQKASASVLDLRRGARDDVRDRNELSQEDVDRFLVAAMNRDVTASFPTRTPGSRAPAR